MWLNLKARFPISLNWNKRSKLLTMRLQHYSSSHISNEQIRVLKTGEHQFSNLLSNFIYKVCELNMGKPVTKTNTRDLWSQFDLWLSEYQTLNSYGNLKKNQNRDFEHFYGMYSCYVIYSSDFWKSILNGYLDLLQTSAIQKINSQWSGIPILLTGQCVPWPSQNHTLSTCQGKDKTGI